jgi:hypothetical protein
MAALAALMMLAPSSARGDGPTAAKPTTPRTTPQPSPVPSTIKPRVTLTKSAPLSAADRAAVDNAFTKAERDFKINKSETKLISAASGLSTHAARVYRARANTYLVRTKNSELAHVRAPSTAAGPVYYLESGVVSGFTQNDCSYTWTIDFVMKNRGTVAPTPPSTQEPRLFYNVRPDNWGWPENTVSIDAILAPGASTTFRYTLARSVSAGSSGCDTSSNAGWAYFLGLGDVRYDLRTEGSAIVVTEIVD